MGWVAGSVQSLPALERLPMAARLAAPVDVAEGDDGVVIGDGSLGQLVLLDSGLRFRRVVGGLGSVRAVLPSRRREMESIFVADGSQVVEIGLPTDSPLPTIESLRSHLAAGNIAGALERIAPSSRARYARIYEAILPVLAAEAAAMGDAFVLHLREDSAIAILRRTEEFQGQMVENAYPVHLVRDGAGEWQILDY